MVVDTSALVAIYFQEPDARDYARAISRSATARISAAAYLETTIVLVRRKGLVGLDPLRRMIVSSQLRIEPITELVTHNAVDAWLRFGKGRHPASLNFGDCFSYALAKSVREPLLFKGRDFGQTDIESAL